MLEARIRKIAARTEQDAEVAAVFVQKSLMAKIFGVKYVTHDACSVTVEDTKC